MKRMLWVWLSMALVLVRVANSAPIVTITSPTNGAVLSAPASFTLRASVSGGGNNVSKIEFFANGASLGVDTDNPYRVDVNNLAAGAYALTAVLTDLGGDQSSNTVNLIVNQLPTVSITEPGDGSGLLAPATFLLRASAADTDGSVTRIRFFRDGTLIGQAVTNPASLLVKSLATGNYRFTAEASDDLGGTAAARIDLVVKTRPTVAFTAPAAGARLTDVTNVISGTASDSRPLAAVEYSINSAAFASASGTANWNARVALPPGTNGVRVRAVDAYGNYSVTNTRSFFQVVTSSLSLFVSGNGTVSGATNGQVLEINRGYRLTATPGSGSVFSNWTGTVSSSAPTLDFLMQSNTVVRANFVPNPFLRVNGTYSGLFYETLEAQHASSGDFQLRLASSGKYSAALRLAGRRYTATGLLDLEGKATNTINRLGTTPLTVRWSVDLHGLDEVTGEVSDGNWLARLEGDRAIFNATTNPAPLAARYTLVIPGSALGDAPHGHSWGTLRIASGGLGTLAGSLADGTRLTGRAPISKNGDWPLYAPLYVSQGSIIGWLHFDTNALANSLQGRVDWFKPAASTAIYYPSGLTNRTTAVGSRYLPPLSSTNRVIALTNGVVTLSGGNLSQTWTNEIILGANNRVTNASQNQLSVTLTPATGLFKGQFLDPGTSRSVSFSGALLQNSTNGAGYFLGTNQSGRVLIEPRP